MHDIASPLVAHYCSLIVRLQGMFSPDHHHNSEAVISNGDWRRYMMYMLVERKEICFQALTLTRNDKPIYYTCGVNKNLKHRGHYAGNFFWTVAEYLSGRPPVITDWSLSNRFEAEGYLLGDLNEQSAKAHYCVHHAMARNRHNMYGCRTPRHLYENYTGALHSHADCDFDTSFLEAHPECGDFMRCVQSAECFQIPLL